MTTWPIWTLQAVMPSWLHRSLLQEPRSLSSSLQWPLRKLRSRPRPMIRLFRSSWGTWRSQTLWNSSPMIRTTVGLRTMTSSWETTASLLLCVNCQKHPMTSWWETQSPLMLQPWKSTAVDSLMMWVQLNLRQTMSHMQVLSQPQKSSQLMYLGQLAYPVLLRQRQEHCLELKHLLPGSWPSCHRGCQAGWLLPGFRPHQGSASRPPWAAPTEQRVPTGWLGSFHQWVSQQSVDGLWVCQEGVRGDGFSSSSRCWTFWVGTDHPHAGARSVLHDLMPYLDDYIMSAHDPFVEDFIWSMNDNRHTESKTKEFAEGDVPKLLLFADRDVINTVRTTTTSSVAEVAGRDPTKAPSFADVEVNRHQQGLRKDEMGSSDVLDVTVFNLGNLTCQTIQRQAEPRMLRLIVNQTSRIMMLVEGTLLAVNQWDRKLKEANWTLGSSDDHRHWVGVRTAFAGASVKKLVDNCGSEHQKIWYTLFEVILGETSTGQQVWKGGQSVYRLMVVHVNHAVARTACRSCRINFADLLILCAHFQVDLMGGDFNAFSYRYFRSGSQQIAAALQDSSLAVMLRRFDEGINAQNRGVYDNHPEYQFRNAQKIKEHYLWTQLR